MIDETDWNMVLSGSDVNGTAERWTSKFLAIIDECIPSCKLQSKQNFPWITTNIVRLMQKRNTLFRKVKRSKKTSYFSRYKRLRNKVVHLLRNGKQQYFNTLTSANEKAFWKSVKLLNKNGENIPTLKSGDSVVASDKDKANLLNAKCWNSAEQPLAERMYAVNNSDTYGDSTVSPDEVLHIIYMVLILTKLMVQMGYLLTCLKQLPKV